MKSRAEKLRLFNVLLKKQLLELRTPFLHNGATGRRRSRAATVGYGVFLLVVLAVVMGSFTMLAWALAELLAPWGLGWLYFAFLGLTALLLSTLAGTLLSFSTLFQARDNDFLLALPIPPGMILAVRLLSLYGTNLLYFGMVWVPAQAVWADIGPPGRGRALFCAVPVALALTGVATVLAGVTGRAAAAVNVRSGSQTARTVRTVALTLGFLAVYAIGLHGVQAWTDTLVEAAPQLATDGLSVRWLPLYALGRAAEGDVPFLLGLLVVAAGLCAGFGAALSRQSLSLMLSQTGLNAPNSPEKKVVQERPLRASGLRRALLRRELLHLGASAVYILNGAMGTLLLLLAGGAALLCAERLRTALANIPAQLAGPLLCAIVCMGEGMNLLSAPSVSLEGQTLWQVQCLPVTPWHLLRAKLDLHVLLTVPPGVFCTACVLWTAGEPLSVVLPALAVTALYGVFGAALGLVFGMCLPHLRWTNEAAVIRQSAFTVLTLFGNWGMGLLLSVGSAVLTLYCGAAVALVLSAILLAGADALLLRWLRRQGAARLAALGG